MTEEHKAKLSLAMKGRVAWNKGIPHTEEAKAKIRSVKSFTSDETRTKMSFANKGYKNPMYGKKHTNETKEKLSLIHIGNKNHFFGKKHSEESKKKISEKTSLEKHPLWLGGISFEPYNPQWTKELRIYIRERDNYLCRVCLKKSDNKAHHVHHIDYNKKNCDTQNLITLCRNCHMKTNSNREYWQKRLQMMMALDNGYVCDCDTTKTTEE